MEMPVSDLDFYTYWNQLTMPQKSSLFQIAKIFAESNPEGVVDQERWNMVMEAREEYLNGGKSYSWDEVKEMLRNKEKRNGLSA